LADYTCYFKGLRRSYIATCRKLGLRLDDKAFPDYALPSVTKRLIADREFHEVEAMGLLSQSTRGRQPTGNDVFTRCDQPARLFRDQGRGPEAGACLQPIYDRFTEGFGTADLGAAKQLLDELRTQRRVDQTTRPAAFPLPWRRVALAKRVLLKAWSLGVSEIEQAV
jgi:hypothetical protein